MARRSDRRLRVPERVTGLDRTLVAMIAAGAFLAAAIVFPRVYPAARQGIQCSDLAHPIGGNNRSVLAQEGSDVQDLDLELRLENETIAPGEPLKVKVTFVNNDIGPVILYLDPNKPVIIVPPDQIPAYAGVTFEITQVGAAYTRTDEGLPPAQSTYISLNTLHLLGSRARCTEQYDVTANVAPALNQLGEYRIRAYYRNKNPGAQRLVPAGEPTPTATPAYPLSQGIWIGDISSEERLFRVQSPAAPAP